MVPVQDQTQKTKDIQHDTSSFPEPSPPLPSLSLPAPHLYSSPVPPPTPLPYLVQANNVYEQTKLHGIVCYLHKVCYCPCKTTWVKTINGSYFTTWPGLTAEAVIKFLPEEPATIKGHLKQIRQNVRSTSKKEHEHKSNQVVMTSSDDER